MLSFIFEVLVWLLVIRWLGTLAIRHKVKMSIARIFQIIGCLGLVSLALAFIWGGIESSEGRSAYILLAISCIGLIPFCFKKD
jgi:uncharacterized YccA/Bax inhibitor family protein